MIRPYIHLICMTAILLLGWFIAPGRTEIDDILFENSFAAFERNSDRLETLNDDFRSKIKYNRVAAPSEHSDYAQKRAQKIYQISDSVYILLKALSNYPDFDNQQSMLEGLIHCRGQMIDIPTLGFDVTNDFKSDEGIYYTDFYAPENKDLYLKNISNEIKLIEYSRFRGYYKFGSVNMGCGGPSHVIMNFTQICPAINETVHADVFSEPNRAVFPYQSPELTYLFNGEEIPQKEGISRIKTRFPTAGVHPLHFAVQVKDAMTDSVLTFEKTFLLRVKD